MNLHSGQGGHQPILAVSPNFCVPLARELIFFPKLSVACIRNLLTFRSPLEALQRARVLVVQRNEAIRQCLLFQEGQLSHQAWTTG